MEVSSNNTNKLSPQEPDQQIAELLPGSNNTNKLSPQELNASKLQLVAGSNNTNKLSPQEHVVFVFFHSFVQIIQINLVLKNG